MAKVTLGSVSLDDLRKELRRRQSALPALIARRDALNRKIAELEALGPAALARATRKSATARTKRARNKLPLAQLLADLLKAKPGQSVNELTKAALAAGYKSAAKSFTSIVRQTLYHDKRFKRVARGKFALKG
jgi:chorismate mutase